MRNQLFSKCFLAGGLLLMALGACQGSPLVVNQVPAATLVAVNPTATAQTAAPTLVAATETAVPPTETALPPTAANTATTAPTVAPTNTSLPTAAPTLAPTDTAVPPTATLVPPTATHVPATATRKPTLKPVTPKPTAAPTAAKAFDVTWKTPFEYNPRNADSFWCQMHNQYQNLASEEMPFQNQETLLKSLRTLSPQGDLGGYEPVIGVANPDGTINHWQIAGWYAKILGWPNGIEKFPPAPIAAGATSDDWTWYGVSPMGGYCRFAYIKWKGQISAAEYSPQGAIISTNATLPPGAP